MRTTTGNYNVELEDDEVDMLITVQEFKDAVDAGIYESEEGYGQCVKDEYMDLTKIPFTSADLKKIPSDTTHILLNNQLLIL